MSVKSKRRQWVQSKLDKQRSEREYAEICSRYEVVNGVLVLVERWELK